MKSRGRLSSNKVAYFGQDFARPKEDILPPSHLGASELGLWQRILDEFDIEGAVAVALLVAALEAHQRARLCREAIEREGLTVRGRDGPKPHPLLGPERAARQQYVACLRKLQVTL